MMTFIFTIVATILVLRVCRFLDKHGAKGVDVYNRVDFSCFKKNDNKKSTK